MAYTSIDNSELYFQIKIWTGNGASSRAHTFDGSEDMQPDWVWIKDRDQNNNHQTFDSVRGVTKTIQTDRDIAEGTVSSMLTAFGSDGFTTGDHSSMNDNNVKYASWNWKAGTSFSNDASSTSVGSIDSAGTVNTTAGFGIIGYTGAGDGSASSAQTIAHGLGVIPAVLIVKNRADATNWFVYHHKNTAAPATDVLYLNLNNATGDDNGPWNDVVPTSTVFTVGGDNGTNGNSDTMIAYCLAEKQGYSKFGSYTGNGNADGTFVYTGFKPAFTITKRTDSTSDWQLNDNKRDSFNPSNKLLLPNTSAAEATSSSYDMDFLSNGFKFRNTLNNQNNSGSSYIYMAFAESPFVNSNKVPNNAR